MFILIILSVTIVGCTKSGPVVASFTKANYGPAEINVPVTFINTSTGDVKDCVWDFGDGTSKVTKGKVKEVTHTYTSTLRRTVTLTVSNKKYSDETFMTLDVIH